MVGGLVDDYLYCGNKAALGYLSRITDWAVKNLDRSRPIPDASEWYTLSENLYRAYLVTGDAKYRDFAAAWEYPQYWDFYARGEDPFGPNKSGKHAKANHAYSHVNTLGGAGAAYLVRGDSRYLDILRNAYDYLQAYQVFATGGYGPDEQLLPRKELLDHLSKTPCHRRNSMRHVGGVQDGQVPHPLHGRRPLRRLGGAGGNQRNRRQHPDDRQWPRLLLLRLQPARRPQVQLPRWLELLCRHANPGGAPIIAI